MEFEDEAGKKSKTDNACLLFAQNVVLGRRLWQMLKLKYRKWTMPAQPIAYAPEQAALSVLADGETTYKNNKLQTGQVVGN